MLAHNNPKVVGMTTRKGEALKQLQDAMKESNRLYNAGIIVSPASQKLTLSMYCPIYKGDKMIGYVGGGPFGEQLQKSLDSLKVEGLAHASFTMINTKTKTYIFSQDSKKIAKEIKDPMLLQVVENAEKNGNQIQEIEYKDADGNDSVGVYRAISNRGWAVVMTDTEDEIYAMANANRNMLGGICIGSFLLIVILTFVVIRFCLSPLKVAERAILKLKDLDLSKDKKIQKYVMVRVKLVILRRQLIRYMIRFLPLLIRLVGAQVLFWDQLRGLRKLRMNCMSVSEIMQQRQNKLWQVRP